jgi:hypothetical protein
MCWLVSGAAFAQVVSCDTASQGAAYATCSAPTSSAAPTGSTWVLWCPNTVNPGDPLSACGGAQWLPYSNAQPFSKLLTTYAGWQAQSAVTFSTTPPPFPDCLPKARIPPLVAYGNIPAGVTDRADTYAVWVCENPRGYTTHVWLFKLTDAAAAILNYAAGRITGAQAQAQCVARCWTPTAGEIAYQQGLIPLGAPTARVAFNGPASTRAVYPMDANGVLIPTPVPGASVAVATPCAPNDRIPGTPYYSVAGASNASQSGALLGPVYAVCVVSLPLGSN